MEFEKLDMSNDHSITSHNVLHDKETGRVVAVFYNDYDLESVLQLQENVKNAENTIKSIYNDVCRLL